VHEFAVGDSDGEATLTLGLTTVNRVANAEDRNVQRVQMRRLDSLIGSNQPAMLKIDVEGHEEAAIQRRQESFVPSQSIIELARSPAMPHHTKDTVAILGIDIGQNTFHLVGLNIRGAIVLRQKLSRRQLEARPAHRNKRSAGSGGATPSACRW
jgi:hypothetical protein